MGEQNQPQGLLAGLMNMTPLSGLGVTPQFTQREIIIELSTEQLRQMLLEKADTRAKDAVTVELHEGKLQLKIRLW
jgi:hypothetical protein